ncbi:MAG TPA: hypothetical protein VEA16_07970 [Vicinamibacterales bacterium]|nr:hypothetical protein [Vicinamibacterales bacterium]
MKRILGPMLVAVLGFCNPAAAQTSPQRLDGVVVNTPSAEDTREDLKTILQKYPASVAEILRRDPSLIGRPDYMAPYPELARFLDAHPEIARNVEFYFSGYGSWQNQRQMDPTFEALGVLLGGIAVSFVLILFSAVIIWLVRSFIQHRRWIKTSTVQAEVHTKLMDRMASNEELLAYVQSPAGRRFLEAAPVRADSEGASFSAPVGSIIWSLMAGLVLTVLGIGFRYAGSFVKDDAHDAFAVVGVIILSLGIGFIVASMMAFVVSSRLGLFPQKAVSESQSSNA